MFFSQIFLGMDGWFTNIFQVDSTNQLRRMVHGWNWCFQRCLAIIVDLLMVQNVGQWWFVINLEWWIILNNDQWVDNGWLWNTILVGLNQPWWLIFHDDSWWWLMVDSWWLIFLSWPSARQFFPEALALMKQFFGREWRSRVKDPWLLRDGKSHVTCGSCNPWLGCLLDIDEWIIWTIHESYPVYIRIQTDWWFSTLISLTTMFWDGLYPPALQPAIHNGPAQGVECIRWARHFCSAREGGSCENRRVETMCW